MPVICCYNGHYYRSVTVEKLWCVKIIQKDATYFPSNFIGKWIMSLGFIFKDIDSVTFYVALMKSYIKWLSVP